MRRLFALIFLLFAVPIFAGQGMGPGPGLGKGGVAAGLQLIDSGFENGTSGTNLTGWTLTDANAKYSHANARTGSNMEAHIYNVTGSGFGTAEYGNTVLTANNSEIRFWVYFPNATYNTYFSDGVASGTDQAVYLRWSPVTENQMLTIYTDRTVGSCSGGVELGTGVTYPTSTWIQYRLVFNFTNQTFDLYYRINPVGAWTQLSATDCGVTTTHYPFRGTNTISQFTKIRLNVYNTDGTDYYLDNIEYGIP